MTRRSFKFAFPLYTPVSPLPAPSPLQTMYLETQLSDLRLEGSLHDPYGFGALLPLRRDATWPDLCRKLTRRGTQVKSVLVGGANQRPCDTEMEAPRDMCGVGL
jgi:hypothetical protein